MPTAHTLQSPAACQPFSNFAVCPAAALLLPVPVLSLRTAAFACVFALASGIGKSVGMAVSAAAVLVPCIVLHVTCHQHNRPAYRVPFFPYTPAASLLLNCFLMASLPANAYWCASVLLSSCLFFWADTPLPPQYACSSFKVVTLLPAACALKPCCPLPFCPCLTPPGSLACSLASCQSSTCSTPSMQV